MSTTQCGIYTNTYSLSPGEFNITTCNLGYTPATHSWRLKSWSHTQSCFNSAVLGIRWRYKTL